MPVIKGEACHYCHLYSTLRFRFVLELSFALLGDDICLSSSFFAGGKFSWSILSNLNLLQSLMTPFGPEEANIILYSVTEAPQFSFIGRNLVVFFSFTVMVQKNQLYMCNFRLCYGFIAL